MYNTRSCTTVSGHVTTIGIEAVLHGIPSRNFQAFLSWAQASTSNKTASRLQLMFQKDVLEGVLGRSHVVRYISFSFLFAIDDS